MRSARLLRVRLGGRPSRGIIAALDGGVAALGEPAGRVVRRARARRRRCAGIAAASSACTA